MLHPNVVIVSTKEKKPLKVRVLVNREHEIFSETTTNGPLTVELTGYGATEWNLEKKYVQWKIPDDITPADLENWVETQSSILVAFLNEGETSYMAAKDDADDCDETKSVAELIGEAWTEWVESLRYPFDSDSD